MSSELSCNFVEGARCQRFAKKRDNGLFLCDHHHRFVIASKTLTWAERDATICEACYIPIATGDCRHVEIKNGKVTMSEKEWRRITDELQELRTLEGTVSIESLSMGQEDGSDQG